MRVQFGDFILDCDRRQLFRGEIPVDLRPKVMELLETLVEQRPNALSKKELMDRLWRSTVVEEGSLKTIVAELRAALNDRDPENPIIRTVQRHGYSFAAKVESGAKTPGRGSIGSVSKAQVREIAERKMKDLNCETIDAAMRMVEGSARSMGIEVGE